MPGGPGAERRSGARGAAAWTCFGRERHPTRPNEAQGAGSYGSGWVALGVVASFLGLIIQRAPYQAPRITSSRITPSREPIQDEIRVQDASSCSARRAVRAYLRGLWV